MHMRLNEPDLYRAINQTAADIYEEWIDRVRENRSVYVIERLFHEASIAFSRGDSEPCIAEGLHGQLQRHLARYYQDDDREFAVSSTTRLYEELCQDSELREIVGDSGFSGLRRIAERHRSVLEQNT
jgi:hypothetical protein